MTGRASAAILALAFALAACTSSNEPAPSPASPTPTATTQPVAEGEIRVAYPWEPPTLNPFLRSGDSPATRELVRPLMPSLYRMLPGGRVEPDLVDRVERETPREVVVRLRADARWSDGTAVTVADFAYTLRTITDPKLPIASRVPYDVIQSIDEPTPGSLRMRFSQDFRAWKELFSAGLGVLPRHVLEGKDFATALKDSWPVSGGPFVLTRYIRGLEMVFEPNPHAYRKPLVKTLRVQFVPDSTTALQLYRAKRVEVLGPYSAGDFGRRIRGLDGVQVTDDIGATWYGLLLDTTESVLPIGVRRAIAQATDRDGIVAGLVRDEGERLHAPFATIPSAQVPPIAFDPNAAAKSLDDAGFTGRRGSVRRRGTTDLAITIASVGNDDLSARVARALHGRLRAAGFEVSLVELEYEELWRDWLSSPRLQAALVRFADPPTPPVRARYGASQIYPKGINYARLDGVAFDAAVFDPARGPDVAAMLPVVPLYRAKVSAAARASVRGVRANASADGLLASADQWSVAA